MAKLIAKHALPATLQGIMEAEVSFVEDTFGKEYRVEFEQSWSSKQPDLVWVDLKNVPKLIEILQSFLLTPQ
jgi:hypothetical protein